MSQLNSPKFQMPGQMVSDDQPIPPPPGYEEPQQQQPDPIRDAVRVHQEAAKLLPDDYYELPLAESMKREAAEQHQAEEGPVMTEAPSVEAVEEPVQQEPEAPVEEAPAAAPEEPAAPVEEAPAAPVEAPAEPEPQPQPQQPEPAPAEVEPEEPADEDEAPIVSDPTPPPAPQDHSTMGVSFISLRRVDNLVVLGGKKVMVRDIHNRSLSFFMNDFLRTGCVDDELKIQGASVKNARTEGIWEEGGASSEEGRVLLPVSPDGSPLCPLVVPRNDDTVNGLHALFQVWPGCCLILGGHSKGRAILAVYRITHSEQHKAANGNQWYPKFTCQLVGYLSNKVWVPDEQHQDATGNWSADHPALQAAQARIFEMYATKPCYAQAWRQQNSFPMSDFKNILQDQELAGQKQHFASLQELYDKVAYVAGEQEFKRDAGNHQLRNYVFTFLQYFPQHDVVGVFNYGAFYDPQAKSSAGHRYFYGRTFLKEGSTFWYLEKDPDTGVTFQDLKDQLVKGGRPLAALVRRMIP